MIRGDKKNQNHQQTKTHPKNKLQKNLQNTSFLLWDKFPARSIPLCISIPSSTAPRLTHQMSQMPTAPKILAHIFHAIAFLIYLADSLLGNIVGGCCHEVFSSYLKMPSIFLYLQIEHQICAILVCMHENGPNPKGNRSLKRLSLLLCTWRIRSTTP